MMEYKWLGAALIIACCGYFGFAKTAAHRKEEATLRQLITALDYMECELQFRLTPLPDLCRQAGLQGSGAIRRVFLKLAEELECQISPDVICCMNAALVGMTDLPKQTRDKLRMLGRTMGRFDLEGQIKGLESVRADCRKCLEGLNEDRDIRLRSYQTLGLCAGAALAILFI